MPVYIVFIVIALTLTSCATNWESNTTPILTKQPVPGQPYEVPPLPLGGSMLNPNPLLLRINQAFQIPEYYTNIKYDICMSTKPRYEE